MQRCELVPVTPERLPVLERLAQLYAHDMSEHWPDPKGVRIASSGDYAVWFDPAAYAAGLGREAFLIRAGDQPAGFILTGRRPPIGRGEVRRLEEFFVVRHLRRLGVGRGAAHRLFSLRPGDWEVAVLRRNTAAARFWRATLRACPAAVDLTEIDCRTDAWDGPLFTLTTKLEPEAGAVQARTTDGDAVLGAMIRDALSMACR